MRGVVEVTPGRPGIRASRVRPGIHTHSPHLSHIDHQAAVIRAEPRPAVTAASHRQIEPVLARELHGSHDVADLLCPQHRQRALVEHAVMHGTRLVVALVLSHNHAAANLIAESSNGLSNTAFDGGICHGGCLLRLTTVNRRYFHFVAGASSSAVVRPSRRAALLGASGRGQQALESPPNAGLSGCRTPKQIGSTERLSHVRCAPLPRSSSFPLLREWPTRRPAGMVS